MWKVVLKKKKRIVIIKKIKQKYIDFKSEDRVKSKGEEKWD